MTKWIAIIATVTLASGMCSAQLYAPMGEEIGPIALDGQANGAIVVAADATDHERTAATELQGYLLRISGAEVPVLNEGEGGEGFPAYVGHTQAAADKGLVERASALGDDGLLMYADADGLFLLGGGELGTYNAVHAFLEEKLGVRWFNPDALGEIVPEMPTVTIGRMDETQTPDFKMRWIGRGQWALRSRQNVRLPDDALGMKVYASAHTFRKFVPPDEYFDEHPEWFALVGGTRKRYEGVHGNQLCTSNPEVLDKVVEAMRATLDDDPNLDIISLFPNDRMGFCECENCKALDEDTMYTVEQTNSGWRGLDWESHRTLSRRMTVFYRDAAVELAETHPDNMIMCGIYSAYLLAPLDKSLRMPETGLGQLCHGWCHNHAIADPDCYVNAAFRDALEGWRDVFPNLCLYEYYYKVATLDLPFPIIHTMREDIPWLRDFGLYGIYTQYKAANVWTIGLNYYVAARLLWDADLDVDALVEDYHRNMYGAAFEPMRDYWDAYEQAAIAADVHLAAEYADLPKVFTAELIAAQRGRLARAVELADTDDVRERVRRAEVVLGYVQVCMDYMAEVVKAVTGSGATRWVMAGGNNEALQPHADAVLAYIEEHAEDHCFGTKPTSYVARFASPANAVSRVSASLGDDLGPLTKPEWLEQTGAQAPTGATPATFDIWLYANDLDGDADKPEHRLLLKTADGEFEAVADVAEPGRAADRVHKCYVISGLDAARYLVDGKLTLRFENLPEDWFMSTLFAWFVMPAIEGIDDAQATALVEGNLGWVRGAAAGFHEYAYRGEKAGESVPVGATIEVSGFADMPLP